ncbi:DNA glycosylase [Clostridium sp. JN-1]|uniref:DNA glycosylase n=1 Tax=Clostridium sp. JN-1 TaxID=2483110 RepID=UPI000F0B609C|nr:DNA glycosylase [Clostridium sp. JN-1]
MEQLIEPYEAIDIFKYLIYEWYMKNGRKFLWRETNNPYFILMSEMMLQRTTAQHVKGVYGKFISKYPSLNSLSKADLEDVENILKSLGLRYRCKLLIKAANFIIDNYGGIIPDNKDEILLIPGVGDYVAGMVMNCAFHKREYVVDANITRIFNRVLGLNMKGDICKNKEIIKYASVYFDVDNSREYAYSIIDFGAAICKNMNPLCNTCPINKYGICLFNR